MELLNIFKKNANTNDKIKQWDNFCILDESFKNDTKLKPIYYLKLYGKNLYNENIVDTKSNINMKVKEDMVQTIMENIKSEDKSTLICIIECLIKYAGLGNEELNNKKIYKRAFCKNYNRYLA